MFICVPSVFHLRSICVPSPFRPRSIWGKITECVAQTCSFTCHMRSIRVLPAVHPRAIRVQSALHFRKIIESRLQNCPFACHPRSTRVPSTFHPPSMWLANHRLLVTKLCIPVPSACHNHIYARKLSTCSPRQALANAPGKQLLHT